MCRAMAVAAVVLAFGAGEVAAQSVPHRGYMRPDGTYVPPHRQSAPDGSRYNNWGSKPNVNPFTGRPGTRDPYAPPSYRRY